jgi:integrator complex subunit 11
MHMGYSDERRFPDFRFLTKSGDYTSSIDLVVISHFHLDHCGALPYFTEMCGYDGPVVMTYPTKAIVPVLLEDYRKITMDKKGETEFFSGAMIKESMRKVTAVDLNQTIEIAGVEVRAFYAGHVLGAAMFHVSYGGQSVVYTGDYNMAADRHLGAAWISRCRPDVLITETTYATTIRDSKRAREREFLKKVHEAVAGGGKVLIPVFALGRAQELCILLETYWERMNLDVPMYFSAGLTEKANYFYQLFIGWTNEKIKRSFARRNMFDYEHIKPFDRSLIDSPQPMVVFATPGMLHAGMALELFKRWCGNPKNAVIIPGYCVAGTVGNKILSGRKEVEIDGRMHQVECSVSSLSFSAHADARGIMHLLRMAEPRNVVLVHGEKGKMASLKEKIVSEFGIPCETPANGESVLLSAPAAVSRPVPLASVAAARERKVAQNVAAYGAQGLLMAVPAVELGDVVQGEASAGEGRGGLELLMAQDLPAALALAGVERMGGLVDGITMESRPNELIRFIWPAALDDQAQAFLARVGATV